MLRGSTPAVAAPVRSSPRSVYEMRRRTLWLVGESIRHAVVSMGAIGSSASTRMASSRPRLPRGSWRTLATARNRPACISGRGEDQPARPAARGGWPRGRWRGSGRACQGAACASEARGLELGAAGSGPNSIFSLRGSTGTRTLDLRVKSPQLYRLSYRPCPYGGGTLPCLRASSSL